MHYMVIVMQRSEVLIEDSKKTWQGCFFLEPPMNKFPLSKQHGLVFMLHRAMEEEKKNVEREERDMIALKY